MYTPLTSVSPTRSPDTVAVDCLPPASRMAACRSTLACTAAGLSTSNEPVTTPGGKPVTEDPGLSPSDPVSTLVAADVMVDPARAAYPYAEPSSTVAMAEEAAAGSSRQHAAASHAAARMGRGVVDGDTVVSQASSKQVCSGMGVGQVPLWENIYE